MENPKSVSFQMPDGSTFSCSNKHADINTMGMSSGAICEYFPTNTGFYSQWRKSSTERAEQPLSMKEATSTRNAAWTIKRVILKEFIQKCLQK